MIHVVYTICTLFDLSVLLPCFWLTGILSIVIAARSLEIDLTRQSLYVSATAAVPEHWRRVYHRCSFIQ